MGARLVVHDDGWRPHLKWYADDSGLWHEVLGSVKARFPTHGDRSFSSRTKTWSVPSSPYERLVGWVDEWFASNCQ